MKPITWIEGVEVSGLIGAVEDLDAAHVTGAQASAAVAVAVTRLALRGQRLSALGTLLSRFASVPRYPLKRLGGAGPHRRSLDPAPTRGIAPASSTVCVTAVEAMSRT